MPLGLPLDSEKPSVVLPVALRLGAQPDPHRWELVFATAGWLLESTAADPDALRWSLPDPDGGFLWRATWRRLDGAPAVAVELGRRLVDQEAGRLRNPLRYPLDQLLAIHTLAHHQACVIHGAGWARAERGLLAAGISGAGKTTLSRLLRGVDPALTGQSDDRVLIQRTPEGWRSWGTPWAGEGKIASPAEAGLAALLLLEHADREELVPLEPKAALEALLPAASVPWYDPGRSAVVLDLLEQLVREIPAYRLRCRPVPAAAELALTLLP